MNRKAALRELISENHILRSHLQAWDGLLVQVESGNSLDCHHAVSVLRELCRKIEHWSHRRLQENGPYTTIEQKLPGLRGLLDELRSEHNSLRRVLEDFRRELAHFNSRGERRQLPFLGEGLAHELRQHMKREEAELLFVCFKELTQRGWQALRHPADRRKVA